MNIYEQLNKINDTESLSEKYNVKNAKELKKLQEEEELMVREKVKRFLDNNMSDAEEEEAHKEYLRQREEQVKKAEAEKEKSAREFLRKREEAHKEVWNLINDLRVKYKLSLKEIEGIIDYELKHTVSNAEVN